jgi:hypothetical protein
MKSAPNQRDNIISEANFYHQDSSELKEIMFQFLDKGNNNISDQRCSSGNGSEIHNLVDTHSSPRKIGEIMHQSTFKNSSGSVESSGTNNYSMLDLVDNLIDASSADRSEIYRQALK